MSKNIADSLFASEGDEEEVCGHIIGVAFEAGVDNQFSYLVPDELWPVKIGQRVEVPFGRKNKLETGFCTAIEEAAKEEKHKFKLKTVNKVIDKEPLVDAELMELARWISDYYVCPLGQVLAAMVPAAVKKGAGAKTEKYVYLTAAENTEIKLKSKKQKQIVEYLQSKGALDSKTAVKLVDVLEQADCTESPIKKLAQEQIIKIVQKTTLKSLPAIPQAIAIKPSEKIILNDDQQKALSHINSQINSGKFSVTLLYGVTDSGKTELYIRAIESVLQQNKTAIVLLPEIALTAQTVQRFSSRFEKIAVMHSGLSSAQRNVQWQKIKAGEANVVVGARSAIFAPLRKLGLVVVDEEHEPSYKQDTAPRYHGRDVAIKRAQLANAHCILGSATPSLETLFNSRTKKYFSLVRLPKRVMDLPMPEMRLVSLQDMYSAQRELNLISEPLAERLREILEKKEQAILLLNKRGYSNFIYCPSCRYTLRCRNCDVTLTFHKARFPAGSKGMQTVMGKHIDSGYAVCHYCMAQTLVPENCPLCGKRMLMIGIGSQRLEEELARKFPQACVKRVDSDSMAGKDYYHVLKDFSDGKIDILAGTQILAKGLHFPNVTLVGIISADTSLYLPDFRTNERTFQLISQVAGRAGRSVKKGTVFVQTFLPEQPAIRFALHNDFEGFIREELKHRKACNLPPFWRLAIIDMRDTNFDRLTAACKTMRERIDGIVERNQFKAIVRGPLAAAISRIQRFHRMQIIIQTPQAADMQKLFADLRKEKSATRTADKPVSPTVKVAIDIDPVNLL